MCYNCCWVILYTGVTLISRIAMYAAIPVALLVLVLAVIIVLVICIKRRRKRDSKENHPK